MAIGLQNFNNITPADSDFPDGQIKDKDGTNHGTPMNKRTFGDIFQNFAKLLRMAGIVANGVVDSEYTGFQYIQAILRITGAEPWRLVGGAGQPIFKNSYANNTGSYMPLRFRKRFNGSVDIQGNIVNATNPTDARVAFTLPSGYFSLQSSTIFPLTKVVYFPINTNDGTGNTSSGTIAIDLPTGDVYILSNVAAPIAIANIGNVNYEFQ